MSEKRRSSPSALGCRRFFVRGDRLHPLWRAVIYFVLYFIIAELVLSSILFAAYLVVIFAAGRSLESLDLQAMMMGQLPLPILIGQGVIRLGTTVGLALLMGRFIDRQPAATMGFERHRVTRDSAIGLALGIATMLLIAAIRLVLGWATWQSGEGTAWTFLLFVVALLPLAAAEEVVFRGYLLRAFNSWGGPAVGVIVTSILFGIFHTLNPNFNLLALLNIFLAGVVFALAVERTGTLWLAIAYHFAWNLAQGPLLGMPVSGMEWQGLLGLGAGGPPLLTGGEFGPEGGLLVTGVLLLSLIPLVLATRRPASIAVSSVNQRARLESRFRPLPHVHRDIPDVEPDFFETIANAPRNERMGEAILLLRRPDGQVLLHTKTFYPDGVYRMPTGGIEHGESVLEATRRETAEETSLTIEEARPLGLLTYTVRRNRRRVFYHSWLMLGRVEGEPSAADSDERIQDFQWVEPETLSQIAEDLGMAPPDWSGWARFRASSHEMALPWLERLQKEDAHA
jgi:hypothetical protein